MSDTPRGGPGSGTEGFAPPDGGYSTAAGGGFTSAPGDGYIGPTGGGYTSAPGDGYYLPTDGGYTSAPGGSYYGPPDATPQYFPAPSYAPQPYPAGYYGPPMLRQQTSGTAVAGMVLGILSLLFFWAWLLAPLLAILGIVFSALGMSQGSKPGWTGMGMAVAGLVCSLITAAIWAMLVIVLASVFA